MNLNKCKTDDMCVLCYTSGTTGVPKGVKLTHKNFLMGATVSVLHQARPEDNWSSNDRYVSFLPSAHSYEQWLFFCFIKAGGSLGFYGGDPRSILEEDLPYL